MSATRTPLWTISPSAPYTSILAEAAEPAKLLADNQVVAIPTETVYGLAANAYSDEAVLKIFRAKNRPSDNPLIVHIANQTQLHDLVGPDAVSEKEALLMKAFWPGPLTLILKHRSCVSKFVTAGLPTVGIRMPSHPVAKALIEQSGVPLAAPSANTSGKPSPTCVEHVIRDMDGRISGIVDGGPTGIGVESTVIDCSPEVPVILRPGGITQEEIEAIIGPVSQSKEHHSNESPHATKGADAANNEAASSTPRAPGMKYAHYAPKAPLVIVDGRPAYLQQLVDAAREKERLVVGVLATEETAHSYSADRVVVCGKRTDVASVARNLYDCLRQFDTGEPQVDRIYSEAFTRKGLGDAVMNRLIKAASHQVVTEEA